MGLAVRLYDDCGNEVATATALDATGGVSVTLVTPVQSVRVSTSAAYLHLREIEVYDTSNANVALAGPGASGGTAEVSSTHSTLYPGSVAALLNDGRFDGGHGNEGFHHTNVNDSNPNATITLATAAYVRRVVVYARADDALEVAGRQSDLTVTLYAADGSQVNTSNS